MGLLLPTFSTITPSGRTGIRLSINILSSVYALHRLDDYALLSLPLITNSLNRSALELTIALEAGAEAAAHAARYPHVDNILYLPGNNAGDRFVALVNHVAQLSSCEVEFFLFLDDDTVLFPLGMHDAGGTG